MTTVGPTLYRFEDRRIANWTTTQEKSLSHDFPFAFSDESPEEYVQKTYLQFLWLPESIMPLHLLVPSLRRVKVPSTSNTADISPIHGLLEPLLLTPRALSDKYHVELSQILADGGGQGATEESAMWYALSHEKAAEGKEDDEEPWLDEAWRQAYLERMERRDVQIQILLYFFKLSLPGPLPPAKAPKRKSYKSKKPIDPVLSPDEILEAFMDKLSMWQLVSTLDRELPTVGPKKADERDWIQIFVEDVVERLFKEQAPELCSLLRSKTFPTSLFPESDEESIPRAPARHASPALSTSSRVSAQTNPRARSRSISVSLAQEQAERDRASAAPSKKRILNREVSMSRVFKPKPKKSVAVTSKSEAPVQPKPQAKGNEVILVEETPQKARAASARAMSFGQPVFGTSLKFPPVLNTIEDDDDEEWMIKSSPDIVMLNPLRGSSASSGLLGMDSDDDESMGQATPSKPSGKRRR